MSDREARDVNPVHDPVSVVVAGQPGEQPGKNGGTLRRGGTNKGGHGRTPSAIKELLRRDFKSTAPLLKQFANDTLTRKGEKDEHGKPVRDPVTHKDRLRALDIMARYGLDQNVAIADVRECLKLTRLELAEYLPREQFETVWARIVTHWTRL